MRRIQTKGEPETIYPEAKLKRTSSSLDSGNLSIYGFSGAETKQNKKKPATVGTTGAPGDSEGNTGLRGLWLHLWEPFPYHPSVSCLSISCPGIRVEWKLSAQLIIGKGARVCCFGEGGLQQAILHLPSTSCLHFLSCEVKCFSKGQLSHLEESYRGFYIRLIITTISIFISTYKCLASGLDTLDIPISHQFHNNL